MSPDSREAGVSEAFTPRVELASYLWEEYRYRHDLIWRLLFRMTTAVAVLSIAPFTIDDLVKAQTGPWIRALPVLAILVGSGRLGNTRVRVAPILAYL